MKHQKSGPALLIPLLIILFAHLPNAAIAEETNEEWVARIVSVQGVVQALRSQETQWVPVKLNDTYYSGDMIRVHKKSRAAIVLQNETILRLDQNTTISFAFLKEKRSFLLHLIMGAVHFFSRIPKRLDIHTPFLNAAIEGTEFFLGVDEKRTLLSVFKGSVVAKNKLGSITITSGESAVAEKNYQPTLYKVVRPRDSVQWALYYPPIFSYDPAYLTNTTNTLHGIIKKSLDAYWEGNVTEAFSILENVPEDIQDSNFFTYRAALLLSVGRVGDARLNIQKALDADVTHSLAFALQSIIAVVQNDKDEALRLADQAVREGPNCVAARIALSYARQACYDLQGALESLQHAVKLAPDNALAQARLAELWLSTGELDKAVDAAQKAVSLNPNMAHSQAVLGFAYLTQIKTRDAKDALKKAIALDQSAPLPRLGLGLAKIREGNLKTGRREIEIAVCLDPSNSLIRSYLGKAYFEEKRDRHAAEEFAIAKTLDPLDPTPWFYDAIQKQAKNQPVEALQDLQKSIELNDNRAVYRSRLMLDQDLAARSASLARIYGDLGFDQMALVEGWKSLSVDPANYSAHRFLADSYSALPRHEIARVSELLQSQLLQPINITPVQPQLAENNLFILDGAGPADPSFNEFNPLFQRNRVALQADGVVGGNDTLGNDLIFSGIYGRTSFSAGQFHYETDGFRENNDQSRNLYNIFAQANPWHKTSILAELRMTDNEFGDLLLRFDPELFSPNNRTKEKAKSIRLGLRHSFSPRSNVIATVIFKNADAKLENHLSGFEIRNEEDGYMTEIQHLFSLERFNLISGFGYFHADRKDTYTFLPFPPQLEKDVLSQMNFYLYSQINFPDNFTWALGASTDFYKGILDKDRLNPKLGITWNPIPSTTLRAALTRVLGKTMISDQTIEPTQVAGFNQFFNDFEAVESWRFGAAIDHKFSQNLFGGIEFSSRDLETPFIGPTLVVDETKWRESLGRAYLYLTPCNWLSASVEYQGERFERNLECTGYELIHTLRTHKLPLALNLYSPSGITAKLKATYINQKGKFDPNPLSFITEEGSDSFWVVDLFTSYRLPNRLGLVSVEIKNSFDERFKFQSIDTDNIDIVPERLFLAKITLSF